MLVEDGEVVGMVVSVRGGPPIAALFEDKELEYEVPTH